MHGRFEIDPVSCKPKQLFTYFVLSFKYHNSPFSSQLATACSPQQASTGSDNGDSEITSSRAQAEMVAAGNVRSLSELKTYDETDFAPPAWAKGPRFRYDALDEPVKHGESSKSGGYTEGDAAPSTRPPTVSATPDNSSIRPDLDRGRRDELQRKERLTDADLNSKQSNGENGDDEDEDGGEEVWENAADDLGGVTVDRETGQFTLHALEVRLGRKKHCNWRATHVGIDAPW